MKGLYLLIDALVFAGPLTRAFEPRIRYIGQTRHLAFATLLMMLLFIPWDVAKPPTESGDSIRSTSWVPLFGVYLLKNGYFL